jgi:lipoprotein signal peptidase
MRKSMSLFLLIAIVLFLVYSLSKRLVVRKCYLLIYFISNGCP